jgi:hypothetical protein
VQPVLERLHLARSDQHHDAAHDAEACKNAHERHERDRRICDSENAARDRDDPRGERPSPRQLNLSCLDGRVDAERATGDQPPCGPHDGERERQDGIAVQSSDAEENTHDPRK